MRFAAGLMLFASLAIPFPALAQSVSGPADAIDGDTLALTGIRIRLLGIDAPESKQTCERAAVQWSCGQEAHETLSALIGSKSISCTGQHKDQWGKLLAKCRSGSVDLGEAMLGSGLAVVYLDDDETYAAAENSAREAGIGLWSADFQYPEEWRKSHPDVAEKPAPDTAQPTAAAADDRRDTAGRCVIKGNHSRKGELIYHLPGQAYYEQTRPETMFCTESEAQAAGYRRSKV